MKECIFCKIVNKKLPADIIDENEKIIVFTSLENHPLIVTKKHFRDIYQINNEDGDAIIRETIKISKAIKTALKCDGINLVQSNETAAGQDIMHFHLHVKPRWKNDNVHLKWETNNVNKLLREETTKKIRDCLI